MCKVKPTSKRLYPYGSTQPLAVEGLVTADITAVSSSETVTANMLVVKDGTASVALDILHIGQRHTSTQSKLMIKKDIQSCTSGGLKKKYCFTGLGKLKDFLL